MLLRRLFVPALFLLIAATAVPTAHAQDLQQAKEVVRTVAEKGVSEVVAADLPHEVKIDRFRELFRTYFDIPSIGRFVLGRYWRIASPEERERFVDLFREVNVYTWARRFKDYSGQELVVTDAVPDGEKGAIVGTRVEQTGNQEPLAVQWRLREREEGYKVVDLIVEGVSMAITYRQEYGSFLQQNGRSVASLNEALAQQLERLKREQPA